MDANAQEAARALARARWGTTATDRRIAELRERSDELTAEQRAELRRLAEGDTGD